MKNRIITLALALLAVNTSFYAQNWFDEEEEKEKKEKNGSIMKEGEFMVTIFGSYPNFGRYLAQTAFIAADVPTFTTGGVAPIGFQFEYMLSDNYSFTLDGIYNSWNATWRHEYVDFDPNTGMNINVVSNNSVTDTRYRVLFGLNYHFGNIENEKFNFYAGGAIGVNQRTFKVDVDEYWGADFWNFFLRNPLAVRSRAGIRFFFNKQWAANLELGAGGPVLRFGVSYRFLNNRLSASKGPDPKDKM